MQKSLASISNSLLDVLTMLSQNYYTQPIFILEHQTIGQQCRHIIEHWQLLINNYDKGTINYANRKRDTTIEHYKNAAINLLLSLQQQSDKADIPLLIAGIDETSYFYSSFYRELDNVTEHIIHHSAIIKMAIISIDDTFKFPQDFGYAPSTISYQQKCVQ